MVPKYSLAAINTDMNVKAPSMLANRAAFRGGGRGGAFAPPLAECLPPLEVYSMALAYRVCLPRYAGTAILTPLEKNPKCSPG